MNVVFEKEFAKVWSDDRSPFVFATLYHMPHVAQFKIMCEAYLLLTKQLAHVHRHVYGITDLTEAQPIPLEAIFLYNNTYLPKQFQDGLRYKAYVKPHNVFSQFSLEEAMKNIETARVGIFDTFEVAMLAVNTRRIQKQLELHDPAFL